MFAFSACQKDEATVISDEELQLTEEDALTETLFNDLLESVDNAIFVVEDNLSSGTQKSMVIETGCPTITVDKPDTTNWPKVITIDWGDGCEGFYGHTRSGMAKITITGWMRRPGSMKTVELFDYYINGIKVEGTKTVSNDGFNNNGNLTFTAVLEGGKLTIPTEDGGSIIVTKEFTRYKEWVEGMKTKNFYDDVFYILGSAEGSNYKQQQYRRTITYRLEWAASCKFMKSGTVVIEHGDNLPITLDYGDGKCDNEATITINGETKRILLRHRHRNQKRLFP
jgi:hypothetical protein